MLGNVYVRKSRPSTTRGPKQMKTGQRLWRQKTTLGSEGRQRRSTSSRCLAVRILTQRLMETNPTENLVGRDTIRRQPLHSVPLSLD
jgi:hypothetical protein